MPEHDFSSILPIDESRDAIPTTTPGSEPQVSLNQADKPSVTLKEVQAKDESEDSVETIPPTSQPEEVTNTADAHLAKITEERAQEEEAEFNLYVDRLVNSILTSDSILAFSSALFSSGKDKEATVYPTDGSEQKHRVAQEIVDGRLNERKTELNQVITNLALGIANSTDSDLNRWRNFNVMTEELNGRIDQILGQLKLRFPDVATFAENQFTRAKEIRVRLMDKKRENTTIIAYIRSDFSSLEEAEDVLNNSPEKAFNTAELTSTTEVPIVTTVDQVKEIAREMKRNPLDADELQDELQKHWNKLASKDEEIRREALDFFKTQVIVFGAGNRALVEDALAGALEPYQDGLQLLLKNDLEEQRIGGNFVNLFNFGIDTRKRIVGDEWNHDVYLLVAGKTDSGRWQAKWFRSY